MSDFAGGPFDGHERPVTELVGLQEREPQFGDGDTQRVYEVQYGSFHVGVSFGVSFGDITQAPTESVVVPCDSDLLIGSGGAALSLYGGIGGEAFQEYTGSVRDLLRAISELPTSSGARRHLTSELAAYFAEETGMDRDRAGVIANRLAVHASERATLGQNQAAPCIAGDLAVHGITQTVLLNTTFPRHRGTPSSNLTSRHMTSLTHHAADAANLMGARSLTLPAIGTGAADRVERGMLTGDSLYGFFVGAKAFADEAGPDDPLHRIDFNMLYRPTAEGAQQIADAIHHLGVLQLMGAREAD